MRDALASNSLLTALGLALLHFWWQGAIVGGVLWLALGLLRAKTAQARYLASTAALVVMAALPLATLAELGRASSNDIATRLGQPGTVAGPESGKTPAQRAAGDRPRGAVVSPAAHARVVRLSGEAGLPANWERSIAGAKRTAIRFAPWWTCGWLAGVSLLSARLVLGAYGASRLRRSGAPVAQKDLQHELVQLVETMGVRRAVTLLESARAQTLCVVGWARPVIIAPLGAIDRLLPAHTRMVLAHELAHIKRCDYLVNVVQCAIEIALFFHPATWWVSGRIRAERELCCDDLAVAATGDRIEYARALAALATSARPEPALAMSARGGQLLARIRRLVDPTAGRAGVVPKGPQGLAAFASVLAAGVLCGLAFAEDVWPRTLAFPEDRSMGQLFIRDSSDIYTVNAVGPQGGEGWRSFGEAYGLVDVPAQTDIMLRVSQEAAADLGPLEELQASDLQKLDLSDLGLTDPQVSAIRGLTGLRSLNLNQNGQLTDGVFAHLAGMDRLVWLGVEKTAVSGERTDVLASFREMQFFDAFSTNFSDAALEQLSGWTDLRWLGLEATKVTDKGLRHLTGLAQLEGLNLERDAIAGDGLVYLAGLTQLERLYLRATQVSDKHLLHLKDLPRLVYVNLKGTQVSDAGLPALAAIDSIETIILDQTRVTDAGVLAFANMPNLRTVEAAESGVTADGLRALKQALARSRGTTNTGPTVAAQASTNPAAPKVGLVLSHFTATGPHWIENNYGYEHQHSREIAGMLDEMNFDVYALIERGTREEGELPGLIESLGLSEKTIEIIDGPALQSLDAIVVKSCNNTADETLGPLTRAVENGTGLVTIGTFGVVTPGATAEVERFLSIKGASYNIYWNKVTCTVAARHPVLGDLAPGDEFVLDSLDGMRSEHGVVNGGALLKGPDSVDPKFIPMYWNMLGKGRCIHLQWFNPGVRDSHFGKYGLYERAINWVSGHPPETTW